MDKLGEDGDTGGRLVGLVLASAYGDALGLPFENLPGQRVQALLRRFARPDSRVPYRFLPGNAGMISDDTEHAFMTLQAFAFAPRSPAAFQRRLADELKWWVISVPPAIGGATMKACFRLLGGVPPERAGIRSAGNGPLMRAPVLGCLLARDPAMRSSYIRASTRLTHTDPRAEIAAQAVGRLVAASVNGTFPSDRRPPWKAVDRELLAAVRDVRECPADAAADWDAVRGWLHSFTVGNRRHIGADGLASAMGSGDGITGYALHTAPAAIYCWWRYYGNPARAAEECLRMGGDTDSTAALAAGLSGAVSGEGPVRPLVNRVADWPIGMRLLERAAGNALAAASEGQSRKPVRFFRLALPFRNLAFAIAVLLHAGRRLLPPYR